MAVLDVAVRDESGSLSSPSNAIAIMDVFVFVIVVIIVVAWNIAETTQVSLRIPILLDALTKNIFDSNRFVSLLLYR